MSATLLGNGRMRLTFDDICIRSIMTIDALHSFGELRCECTASVTRRLPCGGILLHELTGSMPSPNLTVDKHSTPDCRVTDLLMPDAPMLVRVIEAVDAVEFCFLPASDGNFRLFSDYPIGNRKHTVGVITMPDKREGTQLLYLIPAGRASFDKEGKLCAEPGSSVLILTAGKNPAKLVADAAKIIKRLEMPQPAAENMIYRQCETFWREKLSVLPRYYNSELFNSKVEEGALFLLSHFREDGAIITGQTRISEWIPIIECMAKLRFLREARGAADLIFSRWKSHGFTLALEEELSCTYPASAAPGHMAEAQLAYYSITKDDDFMRERLPMLIEAAMEIRQELFSGVFCFGGDERIFREGRLSPDAVDQASASATLRFIHITNTLIEFVRSHQLRSRKGYFDELLKAAQRRAGHGCVNFTPRECSGRTIPAA